jgi:hypothetical protein
MIATVLSLSPAVDCVSCLAPTRVVLAGDRGKGFCGGGGDALLITSRQKYFRNFQKTE